MAGVKLHYQFGADPADREAFVKNYAEILERYDYPFCAPEERMAMERELDQVRRTFLACMELVAVPVADQE